MILSASHNQKHHVAPHFNCLDLRNTMVPLMMPLILCDSGGNGVRLPKETWYISFQLSFPKETNDAIYDAIGIISH